MSADFKSILRGRGFLLCKLKVYMYLKNGLQNSDLYHLPGEISTKSCRPTKEHMKFREHTLRRGYCD